MAREEEAMMRLCRGVRFAKAALAVAMALLALGGCSTSGIVGQGALKQEQDPEIPIYKRVVVNNTSLGRDIAVTDSRMAQAGDILQAAVTVQSKTGPVLALQYRFVWIDSKGFEIDPEKGTWKPLTLYGRETRQIQGVAPSAAAIEYMLKIRRDQ
jgi:uncharacterized protein YcfL